MKIIYIVQFYFCCNLFLAGVVFKDYEREKSRYISTLIAFLFGIILYALSFIIDWYKDLEFPFVIKFYYNFYFTKEYSNMSLEDLKKINDNLIRYNNSKNKKYVAMINKRNNYTHK